MIFKNLLALLTRVDLELEGLTLFPRFMEVIFQLLHCLVVLEDHRQVALR